MGYASTLLYGDNFQIGGELTSIGLTTISGSYALGSITIPSDMVIKKVFLDLSIRALTSSSGGAFNWLASTGNLDATAHVGGIQTTAYTFPLDSLYVLGADTVPGCYVFGNIDVSSQFKPGDYTNIQLSNVKALGNNLFLWDCQPVARVIMR